MVVKELMARNNLSQEDIEQLIFWYDGDDARSALYWP